MDRNIVSIQDTGFHITLWDQQNLSGTPTYFDSSVNQLSSDKANTTRSLRIERLGVTTCNQGTDGVILFRNTNFDPTGGCIFTQSSIPDLRPSTFDQAISSLEIVGSAVGTKQVLFYRQTNYQDLCGTYTQNWSDLEACARIALSVQILDYTPPPPIPAPPGTYYSGNVAPFATRDGANSGVTVDGSLLTGEWLQGSADAFGFSWPHPITTGHMVVWDRLPSSASNGIGSLDIGFSDGTMLRNVDMGSLGPRCVDVTFPAKTVTWINIIPSGYQPGYREVQIWATTGVQSSPDACPNPHTAVAVPAIFPSPTIIAPLDQGPPGPPIANLVVSSVASESSDGVAHDAGHPFLFPAQVHYQTLTVKAGAYASVAPWDGTAGGSTQITVDGSAEIDGVIDVSATGYRGGPPRLGAQGGVQGESIRGLGGRTDAPNDGGGGGALGPDQGGGGGSYGSAGTTGGAPPNGVLIPAGLPYGDASLSTVYLGSGGGSSGGQSQSFGAPGGIGGGAFDLTAGSIRVTGQVAANGQNGLSNIQGDAQNYRGGGGGSGGSIRLAAATIDIGSGLVTAMGGAGGYGLLDSTNRADGGAGGVGRIRLEYTQTVSGTANPPANAAMMTSGTNPDLVVSTDPAQSSDGEVHDATNPYLIPIGSHFGNVTVQTGAYASAPAWNGVRGGAVSIVATGRVEVDGTLTAAGIGYRGGPEVQSDSGFQGESSTSTGVKTTQANGGGGGGGGGGNAGGAGGGYGTSGASGHDPDNPVGAVGGSPYGDPTLSTPMLGSGGGSSDAGSQTLGGGGGNGGGIIDVSAASIVVTGVVSANGNDGESKTQWGGSQGGAGGSGGSIRLHAPAIDVSAGSVTANGGVGGYGETADGKSINGGNGGDGRIRIEYGNTFTGSTTPAASQIGYLAALDHLTVNPPNATIPAGSVGQPYVVTGFDSSGNSLGDVTTSSSIAITPNGSCNVATCSATTSGSHTVTAMAAGKQVSTTLNVTPSVIDRLALSPAIKTIAAGDTYSFAAEAFDHFGNDIGDVTSQVGFNIGPDGSCLGDNCTAVAPGPHTITAAVGAVSATATLTVIAGPLAYMTVSPSAATVTAGAAQSYAAQGFDSYNNPLGAVTIGTIFAISPEGSCTANSCTPAASGPHTVTATNGLIIASTNLTVVDTVPGPPTGVAASGGDRSARVSFSAPASDGGITVTSFTVTANDTTTPTNGGEKATDATSPITITGLTNGDQYTFTVHATNDLGDGAESPPSAAVIPGVAATFISTNSATFTAAVSGSFAVVTTGNPPASLAETGTLPSGIGFVSNGDGTATLSGTPAAGSANIYPITLTASNGVGADANQSFTLTVTRATTTLKQFTPVSPARDLDTRLGTGGTTGPVAGNHTFNLTVTGINGVPANGVGAVALNVTVTKPTCAAWLTVFPAGQTLPPSSNLNYLAGQTIPNLVIVGVGTAGQVSFNVPAACTGTVQIIADIQGWYAS